VEKGGKGERLVSATQWSILSKGWNLAEAVGQGYLHENEREGKEGLNATLVNRGSLVRGRQEFNRKIFKCSCHVTSVRRRAMSYYRWKKLILRRKRARIF